MNNPPTKSCREKGAGFHRGILKKTSSKLCFRWWRLPHAFFFNTSPVYFFRGYHCLFSFFRHSHSVRWKWNKWGILLHIIELFLSESRTLHQLYKTRLQPKISVKVYACVCLFEGTCPCKVCKHRTHVWKCVFLTSKRTDNGTLSSPMIQYPGHSPWFLTWGKDLSVFWQAP